MSNEIQLYVSQPSYTYLGMYEVAKYSEKCGNYIPINGEIYQTKAEADGRASELNKQE